MIWCCFLPPLPSVQSTIWQLFASPSPMSLQFPQRLMELQLMEGGCPPVWTVDMLHSWGYTHKMTHSPFSLAYLVSYNTAKCACQAGVKGRSSTNEYNWRWSLFKNNMNLMTFVLATLVILNFPWFVSGASHSLAVLSALFIIWNQMYYCHMWDYWCCYLMTVRISGIYLWSMVSVKSSYWETCTIFTVWFDFSVPGKRLS